MIGYLVYSYDTMPYSDMSDYTEVVFLNEQDAMNYVAERNKEAYLSKEEWEYTPSELYNYKQIEVI